MTKTHTHIAYLMGAGLAIYFQQAALALFLGIGLALTIGPAPLRDASRLSRGALQCGVVILGLALPFREVVTLCLLYTSPSPRDREKSRMPSSA